MSLSLAAGVAQARTPTPTPTATVTPGPTPTPSLEQTARFIGSTFVNTQLTPAHVTAKIGEVVCGEADSIWERFQGAHFDIVVVSAGVKAGCGYEGATITFFVDNQPAPQTEAWHAGSTQRIALIIGTMFAVFESSIVYDGPLAEDYTPVAYINDKTCSASYMWDVFYPYYRFWMSVYSQEQQPGCGYEGAAVSFKLLDGQGNVIAVSPEKRIWHSLETAPHLNSTSNPEYFMKFLRVGDVRITVGGVGTGDSRGRGGAPVGVVVLGLALAGLATVAAGATLRKRAVGR
jgi:hypothetical protein